MSKVFVNDETLTNIGNAIRTKTGENVLYKPSEMPAGINKVYIAGVEEGKQQADYYSAYNDGLEAGKKSEHDKFWDIFQDNGDRTDWSVAFNDPYWTDDLFKPKYKIFKVKNGYRMFYATNITDLGEMEFILEPTNVSYHQMFSDSKRLTKIKKIDLTNGTPEWVERAGFFSGSTALKVINSIIFGENIGLHTNTFYKAYSLETIIFSGVIAHPELNFQYSSKLSNESVKSIINCLKDYSGTELDGKYSILLSDTTYNNILAEGNTSPNGNTWVEYAGDLGWIIK